MDIPRELIEQFVSLTNAAEPLASQLLLDSNLDVNAAVSSFFAIQDVGGVPTEPAAAPDTAAQENAPAPSTDDDAALAAALAAQNEPEEVRAPIPQLIDTLLPNRAPRRSQAVFDPFTAPTGANEDPLAEMFRPPTHLTFPGSLDEAMTSGVDNNKWILVTIHQADIFQCQVLNRDVWNNPEIQQLIEAHFVFWQRDLGSDDGARYRQFYRFNEPPHIAILDPRSGERVASLNEGSDSFSVEDIGLYLTEFTTMNSLDSVDPVRLPNSSSAPPASSSTRPNPSEDMNDIAATEDAQLAAAIAASIQSSGGAAPTANSGANGGPSGADVEMQPIGVTDDDYSISREVSRQLSATNPSLNQARSLRAQQDSEYEASLAEDRAKAESVRQEQERIKRAQEAREAKRRRVPEEPPVGTSGIAELVVRLPNNERIKRRFLESHTIGDVYDFVETAAEQAVEVDFDLMTPYPKKTFTDRSVRLGDAGLTPRALLVVHVR